MTPSAYNYGKRRTKPSTQSMLNHPERDSSAPAPEDRCQSRQSPELAEQLEVLKEVLAEAEDLAAEFAMEMRMEAKRAQLEAQRLSENVTDP